MSFAAELTRAAAQRGKLDPLYRELSDDWTLILQQLFPVWALIAPGLAEPGHIELRSRTVYLDSDELIGNAEKIGAGALERRAILRTYGVAIHEVLHAKHTKLWVAERDRALAASENPADRQLAEDRALLEEPRMEANGCRAFPDSTRRGRFVRLALGAAVVDCIVPRFAWRGSWRPVSPTTTGSAAPPSARAARGPWRPLSTCMELGSAGDHCVGAIAERRAQEDLSDDLLRAWAIASRSPKPATRRWVVATYSRQLPAEVAPCQPDGYEQRGDAGRERLFDRYAADVGEGH